MKNKLDIFWDKFKIFIQYISKKTWKYFFYLLPFYLLYLLYHFYPNLFSFENINIFVFLYFLLFIFYKKQFFKLFFNSYYDSIVKISYYIIKILWFSLFFLVMIFFIWNQDLNLLKKLFVAFFIISIIVYFQKWVYFKYKKYEVKNKIFWFFIIILNIFVFLFLKKLFKEINFSYSIYAIIFAIFTYNLLILVIFTNAKDKIKDLIKTHILEKKEGKKYFYIRNYHYYIFSIIILLWYFFYNYFENKNEKNITKNNEEIIKQNNLIIKENEDKKEKVKTEQINNNEIDNTQKNEIIVNSKENSNDENNDNNEEIKEKFDEQINNEQKNEENKEQKEKNDDDKELSNELVDALNSLFLEKEITIWEYYNFKRYIWMYDKWEDVRKVQEILKKEWYFSKEINWIFDEDTSKALNKFMYKHFNYNYYWLWPKAMKDFKSIKIKVD